MKARRSSISARLTLLFATASTLVLLLLGYLIGRAVEHHFEEEDMAMLAGKLELTGHMLERVHDAKDFDAVPQMLDDSLVGHHGLAVVVVTPTGDTLFASSGAEFPEAVLAGETARPTVWRAHSGAPLRGMSARVRTGIRGAGPAIVAVAVDISHHEHFMGAFRVTLWRFVVLAALATGVLGWVAARRGLAPLQTIRAEVATITAQRLNARLPAEAVPVELAALAETLNAMLARLEDAFLRLSAFSSDLAHELRTPVSNLLTQTQVTLSRPRSTEEYRDILASNAEEFEHLSRMIGDMLFLAKADNALVVPLREPVDLAAEVRGLFEFYEALAEEKCLRLTLIGAGTTQGDRLMLRRVIHNLLSNALRHTPPHGAVTVRIAPHDKGLTLQVENTGDTIPAEHLPRLFDRFYRADPARHHSAEGAGLGLAITRSIVQAHGGTVSVRSEGGVTVFEVGLGAT